MTHSSSHNLWRYWIDKANQTKKPRIPPTKANFSEEMYYPSELEAFKLAEKLRAKERQNETPKPPPPMTNQIDHPPHYTQHPSGIECIQITEHMNFCCGNAVKYIWRAGLKSPSPIEDLKKAQWYVDRELQRLFAQNPTT